MVRRAALSCILACGALAALPACQAPVAPVAVAASVPVAGPAARGASLRLRIRLPEPAALRWTLATADDVAFIDVVLYGRGHTRRELVDRAVLDAGLDTVELRDVPEDDYLVAARAFAADRTLLGSGEAPVRVERAATATTAVTIRLRPTVDAPRTVGVLGATP